jgi:hypothetical protein
MNKFKDLISVDKYRFNELYEILQYSIIYMIISFFWGFYLNRMFPPLDEEKSNIQILSEIVLQAVVISLSIFYIRKLCQMIPLLINFKGYSENKTSEYSGAVILSIIFMSSQKHISQKVNLLNRRFLG